MEKIELPEKVNKVLERLTENHYKAYLIGGFVRDSLLKRECYDYDITTNASYNELAELFSDCPINDAGKDQSSIKILFENEEFEITTFRKESDYQDHRHPSHIETAGSLYEDALRRDFTINALAYNPQEGVIDYFGGLEDLKNGIIRTIGDANIRFNEDCLRILRALRFASQLGFTIDSETSKGFIANTVYLSDLSSERIFSEFSRIITAPYAGRILYIYKPIFEIILPEINQISNNDYRVLCERFEKVTPALSGRLAFLLRGISEYNTILTRFHVDKKTVQQCSKLIDNYYIFLLLEPSELKQFLFENDLETLKDLLSIQYAGKLITTAFYQNYLAIIKEIVDQNQCYSLKQLAIHGNDLFDLGFQGPQIKEQLHKILHKVVNEELNNNKEEIIDYLKKENNHE